MNQKRLLIVIIILIILTVSSYALLTPTNFKQLRTPPLPKAVQAIKTYAAEQFRVPENNVTILNSEKQAWQDICLDITIPDYECTKKNISGYEATVVAGGTKTIYRSSDDGKIIRIVK